MISITFADSARSGLALVTLALLVSCAFMATAQADVNLCWDYANGGLHHCADGLTVKARATEGLGPPEGPDGTRRLWETVPDTDAVHVCTLDKPIGPDTGCPTPGDYSASAYVKKSTLITPTPAPCVKIGRAHV